VNAQFPKLLRPLFDPHRYKVLYGGRGAAKSWGVARALLIRGAQAPTRILCAREVQRTIADSVHKLLSDQIASLNLGYHYQVLDAEIRARNGSEFAFAGLRQQDVHKIKSFEGADVCWVEEAQTVSKKSWDILIPTIRKEGSEIWATFNPELDTDDTYVRFVVNTPPNAWVQKISFRDNPWFPDTLEQERLHLQTVDPEAYRNVWEGEPRSVVEGAIYRAEMLALIEDKRIRSVPYDPMLKVHTVWDLGWNDQCTIIMAQRLRGEVRVIDYIEDSHKTLADYVAMLEKKPYRWGTDYLPHDGDYKDFKYGKSGKEILEALGRRVQIAPNVSVEAGIKAARLMFPRVYFDEGRAGRLLDCLKRYRRRIPVNTNEPAEPLHDEYSHGADAFRYLALVVDKMGNEAPKPITYSSKGIV
jgi:phage terminase large subunit